MEEAKILIVSQNMTQYSSDKCKSWIYDKEVYLTTIVTEWDLVCDKDWFVASSQSVYFAEFLLCLLVGFWEAGLDESQSFLVA